MSQTITATFENGVLKPDAKLALTAGARVRLTIEPLTDDELWAELEQLMDETNVGSSGVRMTRDQLHERGEKS